MHGTFLISSQNNGYSSDNSEYNCDAYAFLVPYLMSFWLKVWMMKTITAIIPMAIDMVKMMTVGESNWNGEGSSIFKLL